MKANGARAEADLMGVANGDFSRLSFPILVASRDREQFEDFVFRQGLMCSEVQRVGRSRLSFTRRRLAEMPPGKIMILLPKWEQNPTVGELVNWWVDEDRYTVQLDSPRPAIFPRSRPLWGALLALAGVALLAWLMFR